MSRVPPLQRLPPSALTVPAWAAALGFTLLTWHSATRVTITLPPAPGLPNGYRFQADTDPRHEALLILAVTSVLTLIGSVLLRRAPLPALGLLLAGCCTTALALHSPLIFLYFLPVACAHPGACGDLGKADRPATAASARWNGRRFDRTYFRDVPPLRGNSGT